MHGKIGSRRTCILVAALTGLLLGANSTVLAQSYGQTYRRSSGRSYGGYGYGYANSYSLASTLAAAGQFDIANAQAATSYQQAYKMAIDNRVPNVQTYFAAKMLNLRSQAELRNFAGPPLTSDQLVAVSNSRHAGRLGDEQFDPATGALNWPESLTDPIFSEERKKLDDLFAEREENRHKSGLGTRNYQAIERAAKEMESKLHKKMAELDADDFIAAKKFLKTLEYEARFAPERHVEVAEN